MVSQKILNTIKDTAYRVRYFGELFQNSHPCIYTKDLGGMCGICSYFLFKALKKEKLSPVFVINDDHCFVMFNGLVIDVTATQFYLKDKIFIKTLPHPTGNWIVTKCTTEEKDIPDLFKGWDVTQNPFHMASEQTRKDLLKLWGKVVLEDIKKIKEKVAI